MVGNRIEKKSYLCKQSDKRLSAVVKLLGLGVVLKFLPIQNRVCRFMFENLKNWSFNPTPRNLTAPETGMPLAVVLDVIGGLL